MDSKHLLKNILVGKNNTIVTTFETFFDIDVYYFICDLLSIIHIFLNWFFTFSHHIHFLSLLFTFFLIFFAIFFWFFLLFFSDFFPSRFGDVLGINNLPDGSLSVKFKDRKEAEIALANGAFYDSGVLVMDWLETDAHSTIW